MPDLQVIRLNPMINLIPTHMMTDWHEKQKLREKKQDKRKKKQSERKNSKKDFREVERERNAFIRN